MGDEALQNELLHEIFGSPFEFEEDQTDASFNENDNGYEIGNEQHQEEEEEEEEEHDGMEKVADEQIESDEDAMYKDEEGDGFEGDNAYQDMVQNGPKYGMIIQSKIEMRETYRAYAKAKGFGISCRNRSSTKYLHYKCDRGRKSEGKKYSKMINCPARLNGTHKGGGIWMVGKVFNEHNHELEPEMSEFMPTHRNLTNDMQVHLEAYDKSGMRLCKSIRMMEVLFGGPSNLGATVKDCRNYVEKMRRFRLSDGDVAAIQKLFKRLQQNDRDFFYLFDLDDNSRLRNVMWIHLRSRAAYEDFHDVVSFDTTYLVNQYNMPFGSVIGVNHHNQSILLGCCLLTNETAESFKWFFRNWLDAMGGVQPMAILTDQDESIRIALREIMPESIHRFCMWHIVSKVSKKFKGIADVPAVKSDFNSMIYDSVSISEFETIWPAFQNKYGLQNSRWLKDLYAERESWMPVYSNHVFRAGMSSTQRSESMHAFFDHYINYMSTLKSFVEQYEIAVTEKFRKKLRAQYSSKCRPMMCVSSFKWE